MPFVDIHPGPSTVGGDPATPLTRRCNVNGQVAATYGFNLSGSSRLPHTEGMIRLGTSADLAAASSVYRRASLSNATIATTCLLIRNT